MLADLAMVAHQQNGRGSVTVSIKDIAKAAEVSHSTVSRALSDSPLISAETKERIQRLAREMSYSPDAQARSLVVGRTQTIGVVVTTITDPFIAEIVQVIESTARDGEYSVILASFDSQSAREIATVERLQSKRVDGVIVTSSRVGALYQDHLERFRVPVVLINSRSRERGSYTYSVRIDNHHGGCLATEHLIQQGHRRIAYVGGPEDHIDGVERLAGYSQALGEAGIAFDPALVVRGTGRVGGGERALSALMLLDQVPTAAFCYNDMTAVGLLHAAWAHGLAVPRDLAVVGFDDIPLASYVQPPLTTIAQPTKTMGEQAVEMVRALMANGSHATADVSNVVVQGQLVVRESSRSIKAL
jgi:DNA-binding LacI/PurR family transcriptional regulator